MRLCQNLHVTTGALLLACGLQFAHANSDPHTIVLGVASGPYGDMVKQTIAPMLKGKGYKIVVREFSDYVQPNMAFSSGNIDVNLFQHSLYFDKSTADRGLKLNKLIVVPAVEAGFCSHKIKNLGELKKGGMITLFNDPTNLTRGLHFLQSIGPIIIKDSIGPTKAFECDIANNPKRLVPRLLEAAQLSHTLDGVTGALVSGNSAVAAGMDLASAIEQEHLNENLKNIIAVRSEDADEPLAKDTVEAVKSSTYRAVIDDPQDIYSAFQKPEWMSTAQ